jgi:hypothetical protein
MLCKLGLLLLISFEGRLIPFRLDLEIDDFPTEPGKVEVLEYGGGYWSRGRAYASVPRGREFKVGSTSGS